ncbi:MAG: phage/plasmid primase, P4 family [Lentilactobacillus buchneri]|jgi:putative DNA primase/helicase|nr:phage/plasmid primase, P4 family [Lentilactobacillus buchneri]MCI1950700.1 phage/plasmid primase, P4 family [Lentilactobacillus buchneri]MCI2018223.1 phage/plasmid primase, P4 family [Lentilactobacillus buchneri]MCI2027826.1 phage/plasmid primase, P4 family [Lentilactobacillus buchneri]
MYGQIPAELKQLKRWGVYKKIWKPERKKFTKIPINPMTGNGGKTNDESTWTDFKTALAAVSRLNLDGLAFYFKPPYIGIDVDNVADDIEEFTHGDTDNIVSDFMKHTNSYSEISLSGKGLHIIVKGTINGEKRRHKNCEMYEDGRFFAMTGNFFGNPDNNLIREVNVDYLYKKYIEPESKVVDLFHPSTVKANDLATNDIIKAAATSRSGERFQRLYRGEWEGLYSSQSEADMSFANDLAFWTAKDFGKMDEIFRSSGLMRDKYDEKHGKTTYGVGLLNKAIADTSRTYQPKEQQKDDFYLSIPGVNQSRQKKRDKFYSYDDTGNAERFYDKFYKIAKYDTINRRFMYFDGQVWNEDKKYTVARLFNRIVEELPKEPLHIVPGEKDEKAAKEARGKFIKRSRQNAGKTSALNEIKKLIPATPDEFDTELNTVNTPSGYVDLSNGELHETTYKDMFTKITAAEYSPTAEAPRWQEFLQQIFQADETLIKFVQKLFGYTLTGTMSEQNFIILHGKGGNTNGANGKSVFVETLREILNSYAVTINPEVLLVNKFGGTDSTTMSELSLMKGARMIATSETESDVRLSEALIKRMTGGEAITAKKLYAEPFTFMPTGTIWMSTNNKPIVRGTDHGIWRRLIFIPFLAQIPENQKDIHLKDKLMREKSGILNWAVDGALMWQREGLKPPAIVQAENNEYREEMDTVGQFLSEVADFGGSYRVPFKNIAEVWDGWERIHGSGMSKNKLSRELGNRYARYRTQNERGFIGFKIKSVIQNKQFNF